MWTFTVFNRKMEMTQKMVSCGKSGCAHDAIKTTGWQRFCNITVMGKKVIQFRLFFIGNLILAQMTDNIFFRHCNSNQVDNGLSSSAVFVFVLVGDWRLETGEPLVANLLVQQVFWIHGTSIEKSSIKFQSFLYYKSRCSKCYTIHIKHLSFFLGCKKQIIFFSSYDPIRGLPLTLKLCVSKLLNFALNLFATLSQALIIILL